MKKNKERRQILMGNENIYNPTSEIGVAPMVENNTPIVIGIDTGNKFIKTTTEHFIAGLTPISEPQLAQTPKDGTSIKYDGNYYTVMLKRSALRRDKTQDIEYLLLTFLAIAKELTYRNLNPVAEIVLSIGIPPGYFKNVELHRRYKEYFLNPSNIFRFDIDGTHYEITIRDVVICPQTNSALLLLPREVVNAPNLVMVDIGGGTVDIAVSEYGRSDNRPLSSETGLISMYSKIMAEIDNTFARVITESQIDGLLINGSNEFFDQKITDLVLKIALEHIVALFADIKDKSIDFRSAHLVFMGGGSILLSAQIKEVAAKEGVGVLTILNDLYANAKGFEIIAGNYVKNNNN